MQQVDYLRLFLVAFQKFQVEEFPRKNKIQISTSTSVFKSSRPSSNQDKNKKKRLTSTISVRFIFSKETLIDAIADKSLTDTSAIMTLKEACSTHWRRKKRNKNWKSAYLRCVAKAIIHYTKSYIWDNVITDGKPTPIYFHRQRVFSRPWNT